MASSLLYTFSISVQWFLLQYIDVKTAMMRYNASCIVGGTINNNTATNSNDIKKVEMSKQDERCR